MSLYTSTANETKSSDSFPMIRILTFMVNFLSHPIMNLSSLLFIVIRSLCSDPHLCYASFDDSVVAIYAPRYPSPSSYSLVSSPPRSTCAHAVLVSEAATVSMAAEVTLTTNTVTTQSKAQPRPSNTCRL